MKLGAIALTTLFAVTAARNPTPNFQACVDTSTKEFAFCDPSLPVDIRVADLLGRLTLEEKVYMTQPQEKFGNTCGTTTGELDRLGISQYTWLIEVSVSMYAILFTPRSC